LPDQERCGKRWLWRLLDASPLSIFVNSTRSLAIFLVAATKDCSFHSCVVVAARVFKQTPAKPRRLDSLRTATSDA
jgi:hypothetical protein